VGVDRPFLFERNQVFGETRGVILEEMPESREGDDLRFRTDVLDVDYLGFVPRKSVSSPFWPLEMRTTVSDTLRRARRSERELLERRAIDSTESLKQHPANKRFLA
jgi:hypothetical protein